jgi:hypothetical protein
MISGGRNHRLCSVVTFIAGCMIWGNAVMADQVRMRNGDQYFGSVLSLNKDTLVIQSDVLGTLRLPRDKVAFVELGVGPLAHGLVSAPSSNRVAPSHALMTTNSAIDLSTSLNQLGGNSNVLQQIETQYLSEAGPEAKAKFNELLSGYLSGKLTVNEIRAQAQATADQVRSLRKDMGEDAGGMIDGYLAILDTFLKETAPSQNASTKTPPRSIEPKSSPPEDQ